MEGTERAAILLLGLGEERAAEVLKHMGHKQVQRLGLAMTQLEGVTQGQIDEVMGDFSQRIQDHSSIGVGTEDYIHKMLILAVGEDKADNILESTQLSRNSEALDSLKWMDAKDVADLIRFEHPQIIATVLTYVDSDQAAEVLGLLPENTRADLVMRIAALESLQPSALLELNNIVEKQVSSNSRGKSASIGGVKSVADIINFLDSSIEGPLMEQVAERDEGLGEAIQDLMFIFADLSGVDDRGIQAMLREIGSDTLLLALKGADEELQEKFFNNMSKRAAELLRDDMEAKGPVKLSEVETAQKEIIAIARKMAESGEVNLGGSGEEMV